MEKKLELVITNILLKLKILFEKKITFGYFHENKIFVSRAFRGSSQRFPRFSP